MSDKQNYTIRKKFILSQLLFDLGRKWPPMYTELMMTRTKIVCTIGPSVATIEKMIELIHAGMSVARLNFSHGAHAEHLKNIQNLKKAREQMGHPVAIMLDTQGPEIRIGKVPEGGIVVTAGQRIRLDPHSKRNDHGMETVPFHHTEILEVLYPGTKVLFDDGYIIGQIVEKGDDYVIVEVQNNGVLKSNKKMNVPGVLIPLPVMSAKDVEDLRFGCVHGVDFIAASFVCSAKDVTTIKEFLAKEGRPDILVIAKIESTLGVENFDTIVQVADGIMIARGDLGVELDLALVPKLQKMMIRKCFQACKPSITATQMLESMIVNPRPTRAEASDVANAVYDCSSAIMLSGETAIGKHPIETVERMRSIAIASESDINYREFFEKNSCFEGQDVSSAVATAAVKTAYNVCAKAIFAFTTSGTTARFVSRLRPQMPIIAVTSNPVVFQQLALNWGTIPFLCKGCTNIQEAFEAACRFALALKLVSYGDIVVITTGVPFGQKGTTSMMMVKTIGDLLAIS
jgi:pyruvate kinase